MWKGGAFTRWGNDHGPVGGVPLGDVVVAGVVDEALGKRAGQHEIALGHGDEGGAQPMEPKPCPRRLADIDVMVTDTLQVSVRTRAGREHPALLPRLTALLPAALEHGSQLPRERKLQRLAGLGLIHPQDAPVQVDALPPERDHLAQGLLGDAPCLIGGDASEASEGDALVGGLAAALSRAVFDYEGLGAGGLDPDAGARQPVYYSRSPVRSLRSQSYSRLVTMFSMRRMRRSS